MTSDLYPFQLSGAEQLAARPRYYLGDEPGLGKTRTALAAAQIAGAQRVAVVCPAIARSHWEREYIALNAPFGLGVFSYQHLVVSSVARDALEAMHPDTVILDEAHYLANSTSKRTKLLLGRDSVLRRAARGWFLSGTPMPRSPIDLYAVLASTWPERLTSLGIRTKQQYLDYFCVWRPTPYGPRVYGVRHGPELRAILNDTMLRRLLIDVALDLPELRWGVVTMTPTPTDEAEAERIKDALDPDLREMILFDEALPPQDEHIARLRHALGRLKAPYAAELIGNELEDGGKIVVFAYHLDVLDILEEALRPEGVARVDGATTQSLRDARISSFQNNPDTRVFLGQITAASTAVTLTAAHRAMIVEPAWGAHVNLQAGKRIHRIGQRDGCSVRMLALAGTLDEAIMRVHHREVEMIAEVTR